MNLLDLQRRMEADVRRPLTPDFEMQTLTEDGSSMSEHAATYIASGPRLTSFERLEIYNRQYWFRVIGAVAEDFPAVSAVVGETRFNALILAYLREHPSVSWSLRDLGATLPEFMRQHPELVGRRHSLALDTARMEWAYVEAFDRRHADPLTKEELQGLSPESRLTLQPHLQLLELDYPVDELMLAVRRGVPEHEIVSSAAAVRTKPRAFRLPKMQRRNYYLAVHRFQDSVYYRRLERECFLILQALQTGASIAEAVAGAFSGGSRPPEQQATTVQACFSHAAEMGWLCPGES